MSRRPAPTPTPYEIPVLAFDPATVRLQATVAGIAPWVILGTAVSAVLNWVVLARSSPAVGEISVYLALSAICFLILAFLMWCGARAARTEFTGLVAIVYLGLFSTCCAAVARALDDEVRFSLGYCAVIVIGSVFFWPRAWHFVAGTAAALAPPTVLLLTSSEAADLRQGGLLFVVNTVLIAVGVYVMARRADTRSARQAMEIAHRASHDGLTGVLNRTRWAELADRYLAAMRSGGLPATVLLIDVDGFKAVNDTHGHEAGDEILVRLATTLHGVVGSSGLVGRLGGDEFVVLLPARGVAEGEVLARDVLADFGAGQAAGDLRRVGGVDLSIGLAEWLDDEPLARLLARADSRMYEHKRTVRSMHPVVPLFDRHRTDDRVSSASLISTVGD